MDKAMEKKHKKMMPDEHEEMEKDEHKEKLRNMKTKDGHGRMQK